MSVVCHIDGSEHESVADLHALLKSLRIRQADYYYKWSPRHDPQTNELIPYKDYKQYFSQDFASKETLLAWIKTHPEEGQKWAVAWLKKRKEEKSLIYAPTQVELKSLCCPDRTYYDSAGGYYKICHELGFVDRYTVRDPRFFSLPGNASVICDTREQRPLDFRRPTIRTKLDWGDYALVNDTGIHIERKSLPDMIGTLSGKKIEHKRIAEDSPCERFERELIRAKEASGYIVMLVESTLDEALNFRELSSIKHGKASVGHIFKNMRDLLVKYPLTWQVVFVGTHQNAATKAIRIFEMGDQVRKTDLQYALERGVL